MIFQIFLESKYGNLFIKKDKFYEIFTKKNLEEIFKKTSKTVYQALVKAKKFSIYYNYFQVLEQIFTILAPYQLIVDKNYL